MMLDRCRLAGFVVDEIQLGKLHDHRFAVAHFKLCFTAAADDLLRRDAIDALCPRADELNAATANNVGFETVRAQVGQQFEHRLIDHFGEQPAGLRMLCRGDPVGDNLVELIGRQTRVGCHDHFQQRVLAAGQCGFRITFQHGRERLFFSPFRMLRSECPDPVEDKERLEIHRLLRPERAVVIKSHNALGGGNEIGAFFGHLFDKGNDALLRCAFVPRGKQVGGPGNGCAQGRRNRKCDGE